MTNLRLMASLAHPDDETLGLGGVFARYAAEGVETYLVTATRGEKGWFGPESEYPGPEALGKIREAELAAATEVLGLRETRLLDYIDGELDQAQPLEAARKIAAAIRRFRPQVVLTFDQDGVYGHPDHIAIAQYTTAAIVLAAGNDPEIDGEPHQVSKYYCAAGTEEERAAYEAVFGDLVMQIDGAERRWVSWPDWAITTEIDTRAYWPQVWQAVTCHRSQLPGYEKLAELPPEYHEVLWGRQTFYRVFSTVNGGRARETDLFEGLRS